MAKYVNKTQEMFKDAVNVRIKERMAESSETDYIPVEKDMQSEKEGKKEECENEISKLFKTKQMNVRIPQSMYDNIIVKAIAGHENNFTQYIKDLIVEDYERNKDYYAECIERRYKIKL